MSELKPCPFCGGDDLHVVAGQSWCVKCHSCYAKLQCQESREQAITAWNTRPTDTELTRLQRQVVELAGTMVVQSVSHGLTCECWICKALAAADRIGKGEV